MNKGKCNNINKKKKHTATHSDEGISPNSVHSKLTVGNYIIKDSRTYFETKLKKNHKSIPKEINKIIESNNVKSNNINSNDKKYLEKIKENVPSNILIKSSYYLETKYQPINKYQHLNYISYINKIASNDKRNKYNKYLTFTEPSINESTNNFRKEANNKTGNNRKIYNLCTKNNINNTSVRYGSRNHHNSNILIDNFHHYKYDSNFEDINKSTNLNLYINNIKNLKNIKELYNKYTTQPNKDYMSRQIEYASKFRKNKDNFIYKSNEINEKENSQNSIGSLENQKDNANLLNRYKSSDSKRNKENNLNQNLLNCFSTKKVGKLSNIINTDNINRQKDKDISNISKNKHPIENIKLKNFIANKVKRNNDLNSKHKVVNNEQNSTNFNKFFRNFHPLITKKIIQEVNMNDSKNKNKNFEIINKSSHQELQDKNQKEIIMDYKQKKKKKKLAFNIQEYKAKVNELFSKDYQEDNALDSPINSQNLDKIIMISPKIHKNENCSNNYAESSDIISSNPTQYDFILSKNILSNNTNNFGVGNQNFFREKSPPLFSIDSSKQCNFSSNNFDNQSLSDIYNYRTFKNIVTAKKLLYKENSSELRPKSAIKRSIDFQDLPHHELLGLFNGNDKIKEIEVYFDRALSKPKRLEKNYSAFTDYSEKHNGACKTYKKNFHRNLNHKSEVKIGERRYTLLHPKTKIEKYLVKLKNPENDNPINSNNDFNARQRKAFSHKLNSMNLSGNLLIKNNINKSNNNTKNNSNNNIYYRQKPKIGVFKNKINTSLTAYNLNIDKNFRNYKYKKIITKNCNYGTYDSLKTEYELELNENEKIINKIDNNNNKEENFSEGSSKKQETKDNLSIKENENWEIKNRTQMNNESFSFSKDVPSKIYKKPVGIKIENDNNYIKLEENFVSPSTQTGNNSPKNLNNNKNIESKKAPSLIEDNSQLSSVCSPVVASILKNINYEQSYSKTKEYQNNNKINKDDLIVPNIDPLLIDIKCNLKSPKVGDSETSSNVCMNSDKKITSILDRKLYTSFNSPGNIFIYNNTNYILCEKIKSKPKNNHHSFIKKIYNCNIKLPKVNKCIFTKNYKKNLFVIEAIKINKKRKQTTSIDNNNNNKINNNKKNYYRNISIQAHPKSQVCYFDKIYKKIETNENLISFLDKKLDSYSYINLLNEEYRVSDEVNEIISKINSVDYSGGDKDYLNECYYDKKLINFAINTPKNNLINSKENKDFLNKIRNIKIEYNKNNRTERSDVDFNLKFSRSPKKCSTNIRESKIISGNTNNIVNYSLPNNKLSHKKILLDLYNTTVNNKNNNIAQNKSNKSLISYFSWDAPKVNSSCYLNTENNKNIIFNYLPKNIRNDNEIFKQHLLKNSNKKTDRLTCSLPTKERLEFKDKNFNSNTNFVDLSHNSEGIISSEKKKFSKKDFKFKDNQQEKKEKILTKVYEYKPQTPYNEQDVKKEKGVKEDNKKDEILIINKQPQKSYKSEIFKKKEDIKKTNKSIEKVILPDKKMEEHSQIISIDKNKISNNLDKNYYKKIKYSFDNGRGFGMKRNEKMPIIINTLNLDNANDNSKSNRFEKLKQIKNKKKEEISFNKENTEINLNINNFCKNLNYLNIKSELDSNRNNTFKTSLQNSQRDKKYLDTLGNNTNASLNDLEIIVNKPIFHRTNTNTNTTNKKITQNKKNKKGEELLFNSYINFETNEGTSEIKKQEKIINFKNNVNVENSNSLNDFEEIMSFGGSKTLLSIESLPDEFSPQKQNFTNNNK